MVTENKIYYSHTSIITFTSYFSEYTMSFLSGYRTHNSELLGEGYGGKVYSGVRNSDGLPIAIKRIRKENMRRTTLDGIPIEIALLKKAQGIPGVIKFLDHFDHTEAHYLVMEKFGSCNLFQYISFHGGLKENVAKIIFKQVAGAVHKCFSREIAHGDIKDENILLDPNTFEVKIIDFGEGVMVENNTLRKFYGTMLHAPPEWFTTKRYALEPTAVWSLGVLLYTIICGDYPFQNTEQTIKKPIWDFLATKEESLQQLIRGCMTRDPLQRMTLAQVIQDPWLQAPQETHRNN